MKWLKHKVCGRYSDVETSSDSVELLTFIFDDFDLACTAPIPKDDNPSVWLRQFAWTAQAELINVKISVSDVAPIILFSHEMA